MGTEKYAVGEFERRFLLSEIPPDAAEPRHIVDLYLDNTRLRLRSVEVAGADPLVDPELKLGHKRRLVDSDPTAIMHTSMYLDRDEFDVLSALPGRRLVKTRLRVQVAEWACSVNVFGQSLAGLIILEVDVGTAEGLGRFSPPPWAGPELTHHEAFTGGRLAGMTAAELRPILNNLPG